jgi:hypothetical protein
MDDTLYFCKVCGYKSDYPPWGEDGKTASFELCLCCGVEFGYEDATPQATINYRNSWINKGAIWFHKEFKPSDWSFKDQLKKIGVSHK